jgi:hypothetical protein
MTAQKGRSTGMQSKGETRHTNTPMGPKKEEKVPTVDP